MGRVKGTSDDRGICQRVRRVRATCQLDLESQPEKAMQQERKPKQKHVVQCEAKRPWLEAHAQLYLFNKRCRDASPPTDLEHGLTLNRG